MTKFKDETRGGFPFTLYTTEAGGDRPIHGRIVIESGEIMVRDWPANGRYGHNGRPHPFDLIPLREPSEAAVEAAIKAREVSRPFDIPIEVVIRDILRAAYEIDGIGGGE